MEINGFINLKTKFMKNKTTASILAFLFGGIGAHLFYLKDKTAPFFPICLICGIICMALGQLFIGGLLCAFISILSLINFITILTMDEKKFNELYNKDVQLSNSSEKQVVNNGLSDLEKLAELKEKGIITEDEFNAKKKSILGL